MTFINSGERQITNALNKLLGQTVNEAILQILAKAPAAIKQGINDQNQTPSFTDELSKLLDGEERQLLTEISGEDAIRIWKKYTKEIDGSFTCSTWARGIPNGSSNFLPVGEHVTFSPPSLLGDQPFLGSVEVEIGPVRVEWKYD